MRKPFDIRTRGREGGRTRPRETHVSARGRRVIKINVTFLARSNGTLSFPDNCRRGCKRVEEEEEEGGRGRGEDSR